MPICQLVHMFHLRPRALTLLHPHGMCACKSENLRNGRFLQLFHLNQYDTLYVVVSITVPVIISQSILMRCEKSSCLPF